MDNSIAKAIVAATLIFAVVFLHAQGLVDGLFWPAIVALIIYEAITD